MLSWIAAAGLWVGAAGAQDTAPERARLPVMVGFRGVAEVWQDDAVIEAYRSSRFAGAGFGSVGLNHWLSAELELGYMRTLADNGRVVTVDKSNEQVQAELDAGATEEEISDTYQAQVPTGALELVPVTIGLSASTEVGRAQVFGGAGFAMAVYSERTDAGSIAGGKPSLDLRAGARIHTRFIEPSFRPHGQSGASGMDVELLIGRRQQFAPTGFDFSAWRIGAGLAARF